jgi:hypothetical protein
MPDCLTDTLGTFGIRMDFCVMRAMTEDGESLRTTLRIVNNKNQVPW